MPKKPQPNSTRVRRRRRLRRILFGLLLSAPVGILALWIAVNRVEWLGPIIADGLRAVIGKDAVTELENIAYGVQDRFYQYSRRGETPKAYWEVATTHPTAPEPQAELPDAGEPEAPAKVVAVQPKDVGPVHNAWFAPGDGQWVGMPSPDLPHLGTRMWKTLLHPDKNRSWAEVFVVALDLERVSITLVAGSREPAATEEAAKEVERPGRIPEALENEVLAAFNGGFKTEHGGYGMRIGELTYVAPIDGTCVVAAFDDHHIEVGPWKELSAREPSMRWWRQTPNCMIEAGELHPKLKAGNSKKWGATLDGETVIRRSAIGLDASGRWLFVGISNHTTANAIAEGMRHAGAQTVAQLDVNFSYPKFVTFERATEDGPRLAVALASGFEFSVDEYIRKRSHRDFFYITARRTETAVR